MTAGQADEVVAERATEDLDVAIWFGPAVSADRTQSLDVVSRVANLILDAHARCCNRFQCRAMFRSAYRPTAEITAQRRIVEGPVDEDYGVARAASIFWIASRSEAEVSFAASPTDFATSRTKSR